MGRSTVAEARKAAAGAAEPGAGDAHAPADVDKAVTAKPAGRKVGSKAGGREAARAAAGGGDGAAPAARIAGELRKKELIARVAERTGARKPVVREMVEAVLEELGAALSIGGGLNLPPLGKARVNRRKERGASEVLVVRLRRGGGETGGVEGLAEAGD